MYDEIFKFVDGHERLIKEPHRIIQNQFYPMSVNQDEVLDAIERSNFKTANQLVAKLVKTAPFATFPKILEQYVKFRQNRKKFSFERGLAPILSGVSPPNDANSLHLLHRFLIELGMYGKALDVYARAMQKYPNFEIGYQWFTKSLEDLNFMHLQQSSFQLPRLSTNPRQVYFWNALATVGLVKLRENLLTEQKRNLLLQLSYKSLSSVKPFKNNQELIVFCHLCELCGDKSQEIVEIVLPTLCGDNERTSVDLHLKNFIIKHLKVLNDDDRMVYVCQRLLACLDDYDLLCEFIKSTKALDLSREIAEQELKRRDSRNYRLATFELDLSFDGKISERSLETYLSKFHNKPCCHVDIQRYREFIDDSSLFSVLELLPPGLLHDCNVLKFSGEKIVESSIELLIKHESEIKNKLDTDYSACSYLLLNIIQDLVRDENLTLQNAATAIALLENYQKKDCFNYETRVWLIILYNYVGVPSLALEQYEQLKVKNVQTDTISYLVSSRFSSRFPDKNSSVLSDFIVGAKVYESAASLPQFIRIAFERSCFAKVVGMIDLYDKLQRSISRWNDMAESLQLSRLLNDKRGELLKNMHSTWRALELSNFNAYGATDRLELVDNRDYVILEPIASSCSKILEYARTDQSWTLASGLREMLVESISTGEENIDICRFLDAYSTDKMTQSERWSFSLLKKLYRDGCEQSAEWLLDSLNDKPHLHTETWLLTHDYCVQLTTLKTLDGIKRIKDATCKKKIKLELQLLRDACSELHMSYAKQWEGLDLDNSLIERLGFSHRVENIRQGFMTSLKLVRNL
ncbi:LAMI_0C06832g1_1 [Lachancea mirantina]|uniref:LAMI_0C06832g1_1 n=1 Tax=Lachancea mirantina TaxID=1230905 RepID=A0A1G4J3K5_9SACH|nr:LAMI_0C06832g1_1 [Lachancea mirantina]